MKVVSDIGHFYPKLVKEFIVNLSKGFNDAGSEFNKVRLRGHYFGFSPTIINECMWRGKLISISHIPSLNTITQKITGNVHDDWLAKGPLTASSLSVKYVILNY